MSYFPFTFRFSVPGLSNPFASSAPAAPECRSETDDTDRLIRNVDSTAGSNSGTGMEGSAPPYRRRPPPPGSPPTRLVRKRGWQPAFAEPSQAAVITPTGITNISPSRQDMSNAHNKEIDGDNVELDIPPSKRRKSIAGTVISTAFSAALVGAAVGLTVYRLWKDRGSELVQSPPPPYQEEWSKQQHTTESHEPDSIQSTAQHTPKGRANIASQKRHAGSVRHRHKATRKALHIKRDKVFSPKIGSPEIQQHAHIASESITKEDPLDEMDWIGDKLAQLIEEGKRALGKEIVVASEAPEDEVDDGSGDWVEEGPEASTSQTPYTPRRAMSSSPSKRSLYSVPVSESSRRLAFSHGRFLSDDLSSSMPSTPSQSSNLAFESSADSTLLSRTYEVESPSIRESMERARAAYLEKRGLLPDRQDF